MSEWQPIETAPESGVFWVYAPDKEDGRKPYCAGNSNYGVMFISPGGQLKLIGDMFAFDQPKPTHWAPTMEPPK